MRSYLSFEQPVADIDARIDELRASRKRATLPAIAEEIVKLEAKSAKMLAELYAALTPWQKTQVARAPGRPHFADYIKGLDRGFHPARRRPRSSARTRRSSAGSAGSAASRSA